MIRRKRQLSAKLLIMYMISALLFLTSFDLHIHTDEAAASAEHGFSVSISSISNDLSVANSNDEIAVNPDGILKIQQLSHVFLAIFILFVLISAVFNVVRTLRLTNSHTLISLPFYGTPSLRAPPAPF